MRGQGALLTLYVLLRVHPLPATGLSDQSHHVLAICMAQSLPEIDSIHRQLQSGVTFLSVRDNNMFTLFQAVTCIRKWCHSS